MMMTKSVALFLSLCLKCMEAHTYGEVNYLLRTNAMNYSENYEKDDRVFGHCNAGTPESSLKADAQTTRNDEKCQALGPCHIGFTQAGEYVVYDFNHTEVDIAYSDYENFPVILVNITLRVSAPSPRNIALEIADDVNEFGAMTTMTVYGKGYHEWQDVTWENVRIEPYNYHRLFVYFSAGNTNLCSVTISSLVPVRPLPFKLNALEYDESSEVDKDVNGKCVTGQPPVNEPDAETTMTDANCKDLGPCHVAFTRPGESMTYKFAHANDWIVKTKSGAAKVFVDITVRVASKSREKFVVDVGDGGWTSASETFWSPGRGWQDFENVTFRMVALDPSQLEHFVIVRFTDGWVNMCSISVEYSKQNSEVTWGALDAFNINPISLGYGQCDMQVEGMLAEATEDFLCMDRDESACQVALIHPATNFLEYRFHVFWEAPFNIWVRVAAKFDGSIRMELIPEGEDEYSQTFPVFGNGLDQFKDVVWEGAYLDENEYTLRVHFDNDQTVVCSVAVKDWQTRYTVHAPSTYSSLFYSDARETTSERYGDCPYVNSYVDGRYEGEGVDALVVQDTECAAAISDYNHEVACAIGWTLANERLTFEFKTDGKHEYADISFRISSQSKNRRMRVDIWTAWPSNYIIEGPGKGWDIYETVVLKNVSIGPYMLNEIDVTFLDGKINLCSFGIEYVD